MTLEEKANAGTRLENYGDELLAWNDAGFFPLGLCGS